MKRDSILSKFLAAFVSVCVTFSGALPSYAQSPTASPGQPSAAPPSAPFAPVPFSISIPLEYGTIEESYQAASCRPQAAEEKDLSPQPETCSMKQVIYIQDAHDSLEAQENIAKMIDYLVAHYGVKTVFEEGYEGPVPTDKYFGTIQDPKIREKVAYFLMDKLRLGGAEYAHITRTKDFRLIGADSLTLHKKNIERYQESARHRKETDKDLAVMDAAIRKLAQKYFPKDLKEWMGTKERFDRREIELLDYLKRTLSLRGRPMDGPPEAISHYPVISLLLSSEKSNDPALLGKAKSIDAKTLFEKINRFEDDYAKAHLKEARDREIFRYYKLIQLLKRLNAIEVTEEEYEAVKKNLKEMDTAKIAKFLAVQSHKSVVLSKIWETYIQSAVEFYEIAKERDVAIEKALNKHVILGPATLLRKAKQRGEESKGEILRSAQDDHQALVILVYGGFHKENIKSILRHKGFSYYVVTPKITSISVKHQEYYKQLMRMGYDSIALPNLAAKATRAPDLLAFALNGPRSEARVQELINQIEQIATVGKNLAEMDLAWNRNQAKPHEDRVSAAIRSEVRSSTKQALQKRAREIQEIGKPEDFQTRLDNLKHHYLFLRKEADQAGIDVSLEGLIFAYPDQNARIRDLLYLFFFAKELPIFFRSFFSGKNLILRRANTFYEKSSSFDSDMFQLSEAWSKSPEQNFTDATSLYEYLNQWESYLSSLAQTFSKITHPLFEKQREKIMELVDKIIQALVERQSFEDFFRNPEVWELIYDAVPVEYLESQTYGEVLDMARRLDNWEANKHLFKKQNETQTGSQVAVIKPSRKETQITEPTPLPYRFQAKVIKLLQSKAGIELRPGFFIPLDEVPGFKGLNLFLARSEKDQLAIVPGVVYRKSMFINLNPTPIEEARDAVITHFVDDIRSVVDRLNHALIGRHGRKGLWRVRRDVWSFPDNENSGLTIYLQGIIFQDEDLPEILDSLRTLAKERKGGATATPQIADESNFLPLSEAFKRSEVRTDPEIAREFQLIAAENPTSTSKELVQRIGMVATGILQRALQPQATEETVRQFLQAFVKGEFTIGHALTGEVVTLRMKPEALRVIPDLAFSAFAKQIEAALNDQDPQLRRRATTLIGQLADELEPTPEMIEVLRQKLFDEDERVRVGAAWSLGMYGLPKQRGGAGMEWPAEVLISLLAALTKFGERTGTAVSMTLEGYYYRHNVDLEEILQAVVGSNHGEISDRPTLEMVKGAIIGGIHDPNGIHEDGFQHVLRRELANHKEVSPRRLLASAFLKVAIDHKLVNETHVESLLKLAGPPELLQLVSKIPRLESRSWIGALGIPVGQEVYIISDAILEAVRRAGIHDATTANAINVPAEAEPLPGVLYEKILEALRRLKVELYQELVSKPDRGLAEFNQVYLTAGHILLPEKSWLQRSEDEIRNSIGYESFQRVLRLDPNTQKSPLKQVFDTLFQQTQFRLFVENFIKEAFPHDTNYLDQLQIGIFWPTFWAWVTWPSFRTSEENQSFSQMGMLLIGQFKSHAPSLGIDVENQFRDAKQKSEQVVADVVPRIIEIRTRSEVRRVSRESSVVGLEQSNSQLKTHPSQQNLSRSEVRAKAVGRESGLVDREEDVLQTTMPESRITKSSRSEVPTGGHKNRGPFGSRRINFPLNRLRGYDFNRDSKPGKTKGGAGGWILRMMTPLVLEGLYRSVSEKSLSRVKRMRLNFTANSNTEPFLVPLGTWMTLWPWLFRNWEIPISRSSSTRNRKSGGLVKRRGFVLLEAETGVVNSRLDRFAGKGRVTPKDVVNRHAGLQIFQGDSDGNAGTSKDRVAVINFGIDRNISTQISAGSHNNEKRSTAAFSGQGIRLVKRVSGDLRRSEVRRVRRESSVVGLEQSNSQLKTHPSQQNLSRSEVRVGKKRPSPNTVAQSYWERGYFNTLTELRIGTSTYYNSIREYLSRHPRDLTDFFALSYQEATYLIENRASAPRVRGILNSPVTAKNLIFATLDTIPGFKNAREQNQIKTMADLYRQHVLDYEPKDKEKYDNKKGQLTFFYEVGGLRGLMGHIRPFLAKKGGSALLRLVLPELIDDANPDALKTTEVEIANYAEPFMIPQLLETYRDEIRGLNITQAAATIGAPRSVLSRHLENHPEDTEKYGVKKQEAVIPHLLEAHEKDLKGLNIRQAAEKIGASQTGLSAHLQNHPEDFEKYGIRKSRRSEVRRIDGAVGMSGKMGNIPANVFIPYEEINRNNPLRAEVFGLVSQMQRSEVRFIFYGVDGTDPDFGRSELRNVKLVHGNFERAFKPFGDKTKKQKNIIVSIHRSELRKYTLLQRDINEFLLQQPTDVYALPYVISGSFRIGKDQEGFQTVADEVLRSEIRQLRANLVIEMAA